MAEKKFFKEQSKLNWFTEDNSLTNEQINCGSLMRIADATEKMANNYQIMEANLKYYRERCESLSKENKRLGNVISGLRGHIKRIKSR